MRCVLLATAVGVGLAAAANASTVTISGSDFDVTYDPSTLGLFGSLNLVGDNLFFTPNTFSAKSLNGQGTASTNSTASSIVLTAHPGFNFNSLWLSEFGDYLLQGPGSSVNVAGELRAFNFNNPLTTQTADSITLAPSLPLTINDDTTHNWAASAEITDATQTVTGGGAGWLAGASQVDLAIENILTAFTASCPQGGCADPEQAFVEKKFNGVEISVNPVPLPGALWLAVSGLGALAGVTRRRFTAI